MSKLSLKMRWLKLLLVTSVGAVITLGLPLYSSALSIREGKFVLQYSDHTPPVTPPARAAVQWQELIKQKTGGKVEFLNTFAGGLLQEHEIFRGIESGIADIAWYPVNPRDGFVLNTIFLLPFLEWPSRGKALTIYEQLLDKFPAVREEWKTVKLLSISFMLPTHFHMAIEKVLKRPEDIRKHKIATTGEHTHIIKALGATPVEIPIGDWYTALERKIVDGCLNHFGVAYTFGFLELLKTHTVFGDGGINITPVFMIMNKQTWEKLPREIQAVFDDPEVRHFWTQRMWEMEEKETLQAAMDFCKKNNHKLYYLSSEEIAAWRNAVKEQVHEAWIRTAEEKGLPARKVYNETVRLISKAKAK